MWDGDGRVLVVVEICEVDSRQCSYKVFGAGGKIVREREDGPARGRGAGSVHCVVLAHLSDVSDILCVRRCDPRVG